MNKLLIASISALLVSCAAQSPSTPETPKPRAPSPDAAQRSGLDLAGFDRNVRPQDDLYRFTGGGWLAKTEIPADRATYGTFELLQQQAEGRTRRIIEDASHQPNRAPGSDAQKIGDFYASFMDEARLEKLG